MITFREARRRVEDYLREQEAAARQLASLREDLSAKEREVLGLDQTDEAPTLVILDALTLTEDFGWIFFYESKEHLETGDPMKSLLGNAALIVSRSDGKLHETGTAEPIEVYIENFKRSGDPFG
jgi:hypothetical protein